MKQFNKAMLVGLLSVALLGQAAAVMAGGHEGNQRDRERVRDHRDREKHRDHRGKKGRRHWCARHADVELIDLDAKPKVFWHGRKIDRWYLYARLHSKRSCYANIALRENGEVVARERGYKLEPGRNKIELEPEHRFRFNKREHCFKAFIRLQNKGKWGRWEAVRDARKFCAREKRAWTLDERRGHRKGQRHHKRR